MNKQILLPYAIKKELSKTFSSSRHELNRALTYAINSPRAKELRAAALERGGLIYTAVVAPSGYMPDVETRFPMGYMVQSFGDRVVLSLNRATNVATLSVDGAEVASFNDMNLGTWGSVLYSMQQMYNTLISKSNV